MQSSGQPMMHLCNPAEILQRRHNSRAENLPVHDSFDKSALHTHNQTASNSPSPEHPTVV